MLTNQQQQDPQSEELNFTAFTDLCRFCSLRLGAKINLFDKEAEHRQLLFKVRTFLPTAVYILHMNQLNMLFYSVFDFRYQKMIFFPKKFVNDVL